VPWPSLSNTVPGMTFVHVLWMAVVVGVLFGTKCVTGLLAGAIASGVQMAISASNTGGAWDNAKKYIGKGGLDELIAQVGPECSD